MLGKPETREVIAAGKTGAAAPSKATPDTAEAMKTLFNQILLTMEKEGVPSKDVVRMGELFNNTIPVAEVSPKEQQEANRSWANKVSTAYARLHKWGKDLEALREEARLAKRRVESAEKHIEYWQAKLNAAERKDQEQWANIAPFEDIDFERDTDADGELSDEDDIDSMDANTPSTIVAGQPSTNTSAITIPMVGEAFPPTTRSPFLGVQAADGQTAGQQDALDAVFATAEFRQNTLKTGAASNGWPTAIITKALEHDCTWEEARAAFETAKLMVALAHHEKKLPTLAHNPLVQQFADIFLQITPVTQQIVAELPSTAEIEAAGGVQT